MSLPMKPNSQMNLIQIDMFNAELISNQIYMKFMSTNPTP